MGSMTGRLYEKIAWEQGCSVLDKVVLTDSSATWSSSLGEVFINACECQHMIHVTAGLQAPRGCTCVHEHILHGHLGLPFSGKYDSIDCSCINGQMFSVNNLRLKITVIRFYFIVKISSYKENVWKYFTQIILWRKFFHIGRHCLQTSGFGCIMLSWSQIAKLSLVRGHLLNIIPANFSAI